MTTTWSHCAGGVLPRQGAGVEEFDVAGADEAGAAVAGAAVAGAVVAGAAVAGADGGAADRWPAAEEQPATRTAATRRGARRRTSRFYPVAHDPVRSAAMTELRGSTALVTGATGGLGRAIARTLAAEGCSVVVTGRQAGPLDQLATEIGGRAVLADLGRRSDLDRMIEEAGQVDIAVFNAALPGSGELPEWEQEQIDRLLEINLGGPVAATRTLLPGMISRRRGHLVYISSLAGKVASRGAPLYSATKYGLRGFAHAVRCDLHGSGVGCSVINPGFVRDAGMFADAGATLPPGVATVSPEQVAAAVVRAVRRDRAEIDVAPLTLRLGALFGSVAPGISTVVQARAGAGISRQMVEGQRHKRA
jgi:short-subunit dehydrogenase